MTGGAWSHLVRGAVAGAAGTTALNAVTYADMAVRARPASSTPQDTVEELTRRAGVKIPGDDDARGTRIEALGPLTGTAAGIGAGVLLGAGRAAGWRPSPLAAFAVATLGALLAGNAPMTALGITDPRSWDTNAWLTDLVPHVAYGAVTAYVFVGLDSD